MRNRFITLLFYAFILIPTLSAQSIKVAVSANFYLTLKKISTSYSKTKIIPIVGSTAQLFSQIKNGAPFDLYLAADQDHPTRLYQLEDFQHKPFVYAQGQLIIWSHQEKLLNNLTLNFDQINLKHFAIANPKLAPYGKQALHFLKELPEFKSLKSKLRYADNISQCFQYIQTQNAELGIIAYSQWTQLPQNAKGSYYLIPQEKYQPILQHGIALNNNSSTHDFCQFLLSKASQTIIQKDGYLIP